MQDSIAFSRTGLDFFTRLKSRVLLELASARVGDPSRLELIDVGCGPGETDRFLQGAVKRLAGVDVSRELIESARERNPWAEYETIKLGARLPFTGREFDVAFAICVLHHVPPPRRPELVAEMKRVTRSGGMVAIFEHNPWNPLTRRAVSSCEFDRDAVLLSRGEAKRLLEGADLAGVEGRYIVFFTRDSTAFRRIERRLGWVPLGAQYVVSGLRP